MKCVTPASIKYIVWPHSKRIIGAAIIQHGCRGEERRWRISQMKEEQQEKVTVYEVMQMAVTKFEEDLIAFTERNWCPSQVEMLKSAIECVYEGKEVYAPIEEDEPNEKRD